MVHMGSTRWETQRRLLIFEQEHFCPSGRETPAENVWSLQIVGMNSDIKHNVKAVLFSPMLSVNLWPEYRNLSKCKGYHKIQPTDLMDNRARSWGTFRR